MHDGFIWDSNVFCLYWTILFANCIWTRSWRKISSTPNFTALTRLCIANTFIYCTAAAVVMYSNCPVFFSIRAMEIQVLDEVKNMNIQPQQYSTGISLQNLWQTQLSCYVPSTINTLKKISYSTLTEASMRTMHNARSEILKLNKQYFLSLKKIRISTQLALGGCDGLARPMLTH